MNSHNILDTIMSSSSLIFWKCHFCPKSQCYNLLLLAVEFNPQLLPLFSRSVSLARHYSVNPWIRHTETLVSSLLAVFSVCCNHSPCPSNCQQKVLPLCSSLLLNVLKRPQKEKQRKGFPEPAEGGSSAPFIMCKCERNLLGGGLKMLSL